MSLTKDSLIEAAQVRAKSAKRQARTAKADLTNANHELDAAIAEGKPAKVRVAREHTRSAEVAITEAAENLGKVEGLLDLASSSPSPKDPAAGFAAPQDKLNVVAGKKTA